MALDAGFGVGIAAVEALQGFVDFLLTRTRDGDDSAVFDAGFSDAEADAASPADDEDAFSLQLVGVFEGHVERLVLGE